MVEEKRAKLKKTREMVEVLGTASGYYLDQLIDRAVGGELASTEIPVYLVWYTLEKVPKKLVKEERIRECLRPLGLPEHEIEAHESTGGGRVRYRDRCDYRT